MLRDDTEYIILFAENTVVVYSKVTNGVFNVQNFVLYIKAALFLLSSISSIFYSRKEIFIYYYISVKLKIIYVLLTCITLLGVMHISELIYSQYVFYHHQLCILPVFYEIVYVTSRIFFCCCRMYNYTLGPEKLCFL